ncbi:MAG: CbbQ/NirQ/NorQ/GpvN family protein [Pseudomonadales bacterium]
MNKDAIATTQGAIAGYALNEEPYYLPLGDEVELFMAAWEQRLPVLLKGPTGCGKTRFVEYLAHRIYRGEGARQSLGQPLQTVACHEDLSATDLVGRFLLKGEETVWQDGPLTKAVREGAICYLDEIVEARKDSTVLIHSLTDHRRILPMEKLGEILEAHPDFLLVISYNPGYQNVLKDLKPSTRQRFVAIEFDYPSEAREAEIIVHESGVDSARATDLARLGARIRHLRSHGFDEGVSTRLLVYAAQLMVQGVSAARACDAAVSRAVSDDPDVQATVAELASAIFPPE